MTDVSRAHHSQSTNSKLVEEALETAANFHCDWVSRLVERAEATVREVTRAAGDLPAVPESALVPANPYGLDLNVLAAGYAAELRAERAEKAAAGDPQAILEVRADEAVAEALRVTNRHDAAAWSPYRLLPHTAIPRGLSDEWRGVLDALSRPVWPAMVFFGIAGGPDLPAEGLTLYTKALRLAVEHAHAVLPQLTDQVARTRRAGLAILDAVSPIKAAVKRAAFCARSGSSWADQCAAARAELVGLKRLDLAPLLEELYSAVAFDSRRDLRVGLPPKEPPAPTIWHHGGQSYSRDGINSYVVKDDEDYVLQAFLEAKRAMGTAELADESGVANVARTIAQLLDGYGGVFADAIRTPEKKGAGGYLIHVRTTPPS
jgi:hypothetical protein